MNSGYRRVCVYCGSSRQCDAAYLEAAKQLGCVLGRSGLTVVYGGGGVGSMGALADGALAEGGRVVGVIPRFMVDLEWGHSRLSERVVVKDMHERKRRMIEGSDAAIALPGGCGTMEELMEAITWKRLGLYWGAIVLVNTRDYFQPLLQMLDQSIAERFMDPRHGNMWDVVGRPEEVPEAIRAAVPWDADCRKFAAI
jgi:uncharacterized protein (TIGR00730 family)